MTVIGKQKRYGRKASGTSLSEFGPALMILFLCFFFPLIDTMALGVSYGAVQMLNSNQVHEASLIPSGKALAPNGSIKQGIPAKWMAGMGQFVKMQGQVATTVSYRNGTTIDGVTDKIVTVTTTVVCRPFVPVFPIPGINIPGMNAPFTFQVTSDRVMENPDYAST